MATCSAAWTGGRSTSRDAGASRGRERGQQRLVRVVDQRIEIAAVHGERDVQADVASGLGDRARLGREIGQALDARIVRHGGAHAAARNAPERHRRGEPGIDRGD
jgi:hypothetical protein